MTNTHSYEGAFEAFLAEYQGSGSRLDRLETMIAKKAWDSAIAHMQSSGPNGEMWWRDALRERPHPNRLVIAWTKEYGALLADRTTSNPQFGWSCDGTVTHWMPLPEIPSPCHTEERDMSKPSKEELWETKGYMLGISEGLFTAMRYLNERAGECYKRRDDKQSAFYRAASDEIAKLASEARARYDKEYPK